MAGEPLAIDLCCGLGGWAEGLLAEGYHVIGFDIERHEYGEHRYPATLVVQDIRTLHGSQLRSASLIVASPPCQFYSYCAMPWTKAKELAATVRADQSRLDAELELFRTCFRLQREAIEASGHHIPLIVENVRGAIPWVGRSRWNFGSYHLWGDVPALMPSTRDAPILKAQPYQRRHGTGSWFAIDMASARAGVTDPKDVGHKTSGMNWSDRSKRGQDFTRIAGNQAIGIKQHGSGREWFAGEGTISRHTTSGSPARKMASAMIAKIPLPLSRHIGATFRPASADGRRQRG